jgi:hypothetical protein
MDTISINFPIKCFFLPSKIFGIKKRLNCGLNRLTITKRIDDYVDDVYFVIKIINS